MLWRIRVNELMDGGMLLPNQRMKVSVAPPASWIVVNAEPSPTVTQVTVPLVAILFLLILY